MTLGGAVLFVSIFSLTLLMVDYALYNDIKNINRDLHSLSDRIKIVFFILVNVVFVGLIIEVILIYYKIDFFK
ncbi:hypothetical protein [Clostridium drakei]|uniref:Uncharacterized protein n=1 Tax=Clostridium drakei TaxID=332101 RepID=A0A2U8DMH6_9CLOT|nr:hypothetical protein [Clostridium drakei]AWI03394.1 hypothetical protein B9W14_02405 [Clostridium drakei]